ncbi:MAG: NAD(P)H-dependent oxidoreductase [Chitinophagaceae bacterium]
MNIEVVAGSPRKGSISERLAIHLRERISKKAPQHNVGLINMQHVKLDFVQSVWSCLEKVPEEHQSIAQRMFAADAFVIVSPEYNGGYSPALKNLFDHFPKQLHKAFGIATSSDGALGGMRAAQQLLLLVPALFGVASPFLLPMPLVDKKLSPEGVLLDETLENRVESFVTEFLWLAAGTKN